jgi:hypothetical protein
VVLQKLTIKKARFLVEKGHFGSGRVPEFFRFFDAAVAKRGRFPGVFRERAIYSTRSIGVFSVVFLKSKNVLHGEAPFSRRKRGFLGRVFADELFFNDHLLAKHLMASHQKATMPCEKNSASWP